VSPAGAAPSAADVTRQYLDEHPSIREGLLEDLVNYTALARKIQAERNLRNEEAVTVALRRYQRAAVAEDPPGRSVHAVLAESRLQVHSRVALVRVRDDSEVLERLYAAGRRLFSGAPPHRMFQLFQGTRALTVLCEEDFLGGIRAEVPDRLLLGVERGLGTLVLRAPPRVAQTPGVLARLVQALFERGINTLETVSVHSDSIFVFRDPDLIPAFQVLTGLLAAEPLR
jgi:hypothetical protein